MAAHFNKSARYHRDVEPDSDLINTLLGGAMSLPQFYPQTMHQTGPLPDFTGPEADLSRFSSYEEAYHQLLIHLVKWQVVSLAFGTRNRARPSGICIGRVLSQFVVFETAGELSSGNAGLHRPVGRSLGPGSSVGAASALEP